MRTFNIDSCRCGLILKLEGRRNNPKQETRNVPAMSGCGLDWRKAEKQADLGYLGTIRLDAGLRNSDF